MFVNDVILGFIEEAQEIHKMELEKYGANTLYNRFSRFALYERLDVLQDLKEKIKSSDIDVILGLIKEVKEKNEHEMELKKYDDFYVFSYFQRLQELQDLEERIIEYKDLDSLPF